MKTARSENGIALVTAIILLTVMMGLGMGLLLLTDNQQKASAREQASESAFNVAEAALNAQIGQLSRVWPGTKELAIPSRCTAATSTSTNGCPDAGSLNAGYPNISPVQCPAGTTGEAWESPLTNQWTTYVRDDVSEAAYFTSASEKEALTYDANADNKLWVRSVGVVQCHVVTVAALVSAQSVTLPFPQYAVTGNWFETSNNGNKVIIDTQGKASQPAGVSMRCSGYSSKEECEKYRRGAQVSPDTTETTPASPSQTLSASQLETFKNAAKAAGTYFPSGKCPEGPEQVSGKQVYVEGPCEITSGGNSEASPGFLVIVNGTFRLNGNSQFFGTLYLVNAQNSTGVVVELHGNSHLYGSIDVDGNGGISFGSSKENFVYDGTAVKEVKTFAGASATRNSFRVLPAGQ
jgi:Tfp pilus assembly protein PilX